MAEVRRVADDLATGNAHPLEAKKHLAWAVVREYHGQPAADATMAEWNRVRGPGRALPSDIPAVTVRGEEIGVVELLLLTGVEPSKNQARRDITQGGVTINGEADQRHSGPRHPPRRRRDPRRQAALRPPGRA